MKKLVFAVTIALAFMFQAPEAHALSASTFIWCYWVGWSAPGCLEVCEKAGHSTEQCRNDIGPAYTEITEFN